MAGCGKIKQDVQDWQDGERPSSNMTRIHEWGVSVIRVLLFVDGGSRKPSTNRPRILEWVDREFVYSRSFIRGWLLLKTILEGKLRLHHEYTNESDRYLLSQPGPGNQLGPADVPSMRSGYASVTMIKLSRFDHHTWTVIPQLLFRSDPKWTEFRLYIAFHAGR